MSQRTQSWLSEHPFLALLLAGLGLWLGWKILAGIYYLTAACSKTLFLTMDASYGQVGGAAGYALLGLLLGAAAGVAAAQRRFRLNRGLLLGAALLAIATLATVYFGSLWADDYPESYSSPTTPPVTLPQEAAAPVRAVPEAAATSLAQPDTATQAAEGLYTAGETLHLLPDWRDSLNPGLTYRSGADTLQLHRRAGRWGLVSPLVPPGQPLPYSGWVQLSQLTRLVPGSREVPTPSEPAVASVADVPAATEATADSVQADEQPAPASHPVGQQQHNGKVGNMAAQFNLDWQPNGELSGSYYYEQQPGTRYRLTGTVTAAGELRLLEFTRGRQSARCTLQRREDGYAGTMYNTDGRQFPMSILLAD